MSDQDHEGPQETPQDQQNTAGQATQDDESGADQLGDAGKRALDAERTARKESDTRLKEALAKLEQFEDAQRTDEEKREHELTTLRQQLDAERTNRAKVERDLLVNSVAAEHGLPPELAARLAGDDREELVEDAKVLQGLMKPDGPRRPAPVPEEGRLGRPKLSHGEIFEDAWSKAFG